MMSVASKRPFNKMTIHPRFHALLASRLMNMKRNPDSAGHRPPAPRLRVTPVLLALFAASLTIATSSCTKEAPASPPPPTVEVVAVEQRDVPIYSEVVGTMEADVNATISAQVSGYLMSRNYTEGSVVTNGQILFQIDYRTYKAALDQAQAKVNKTQMDVERYTPLAATQAISQQELDDAIQAKAAAVAARDQAKLNYEFCTIRSPIDGLAGLAQAQVGDLIGPGTGPLTSVNTMDPIRVYFSVAQQMMTQLMQQRLDAGKEVRVDKGDGAPLELTLATGAAYPLKGSIRFANNQVDVKTGTIRVVGEFRNPDRLLVPGMFVRVRAQIGLNKNALLVPQRAVAEMQGRKLIAVVGADNKVSIKPISTGETFGDKWIITGPLQPGDKVVAEGIQKVRDGSTVNPVPFGSIPKETPAATGAPENKS
jgi:membrane fusion protein, multidrug efflux system